MGYLCIEHASTAIHALVFLLASLLDLLPCGVPTKHSSATTKSFVAVIVWRQMEGTRSKEWNPAQAGGRSLIGSDWRFDIARFVTKPCLFVIRWRVARQDGIISFDYLVVYFTCGPLFKAWLSHDDCDYIVNITTLHCYRGRLSSSSGCDVISRIKSCKQSLNVARETLPVEHGSLPLGLDGELQGVALLLRVVVVQVVVLQVGRELRSVASRVNR